MVYILAAELTPYRLRYLQGLLSACGLEGVVLSDQAAMPAEISQTGMILAIGPAAVKTARRWLQQRPGLKLYTISSPLSSFVGLTANLDLAYRQCKERQRLSRLLTSWASQAKRPQAPAELPAEVFLGTEVPAELEQDAGGAWVCKLTPHLEVGIYADAPQGRYPVEMTVSEFRNLMYLREVMGGRMTAVKDACGVRHSLDQDDYGQE